MTDKSRTTARTMEAPVPVATIDDRSSNGGQQEEEEEEEGLPDPDDFYEHLDLNFEDLDVLPTSDDEDSDNGGDDKNNYDNINNNNSNEAGQHRDEEEEQKEDDCFDTMTNNRSLVQQHQQHEDDMRMFSSVAAVKEETPFHSVASKKGSDYDDDEYDDDLGKKKKALQKGDIGMEDAIRQEYILGTLIVRVAAARDLEGVEQSNGGLGQLLFGGAGGGGRNSSLSRRRGRGNGTANPYASVRFGRTTQRTSEVFDTTDPVWPRGEAMYMDVTHPMLHVDAFQQDEQMLEKLDPSDDDDDENNEQEGDPGDPPKKPSSSSVVKRESKTVARAKAEAKQKQQQQQNGGRKQQNNNDPSIPCTPDRPILTVAIFHSSRKQQQQQQQQQKYNPSKASGGVVGSSGDSDDIFLGMAAVDLTHLLTGKYRTYDHWLPLTGTSASCTTAAVRIVCEYESSDAPPHPGDLVRFTGYCRVEDLYPAQAGRLYKVMESLPDDNVLIGWTSPEGWLSTFLAHRYMLICEERHQGALEFYQDELASITERLSHSPLVSTVHETVERVPDDGLISVSVDAIKGGANLLNRWVTGGLGTAVGDLTFATNWDGRFNPDLAASLSTASPDDDADNDDINMGEERRRTAAESWKLDMTSGNSSDGWNNATASTPLQLQLPPLPNMPACPITGEPMRDPVVAADGHTYERRAIARWLTNSNKSPLTGSVLPHKNLVPNYMLLSSLQETARLAALTETSSGKDSAKSTPTGGELFASRVVDDDNHKTTGLQQNHNDDELLDENEEDGLAFEDIK